MTRQILTIGLTDDVNDIFKKYFSLDQMRITTCKDISDAMVQLGKEHFRLIIYDASALSSADAQEMASRIRRITYNTPLVMLTIDEAAAATQEAGADICVSPDIDLHRLFSTVMGQIRRNKCFSQYDDVEPGAIVLYRDDLMADSSRHCVAQSGNAIHLMPQEFRLLTFMMRNAGLVLTAEQLGPAIWLEDNHTAKDVARIIANVRHKLKDSRNNPRYIETVHGVGYRFMPTK